MKELPIGCPDVVITAGGTREQIDDVRYITNFSSGGFGHELAKQYAQYGMKVLLLAPKLTVQKYGALPANVTHQEFTSAEDLREKLLSVETARFVLHAAAVSDYTPVSATQGKLSSDAERMTIELKRTPKILPQLREKYGSETKIVGFKLLSGVEESELIEAAVQQLSRAHTDLCIANDLQEMSGGDRKIHIVQPDGGYETLIGTTTEAAKAVVQAVSFEHIEEITHQPAILKRIAEAIEYEQADFGFSVNDENGVIRREVEGALAETLIRSDHPMQISELMDKTFDGYLKMSAGYVWVVWIVLREMISSGKVHNSAETSGEFRDTGSLHIPTALLTYGGV